jgi:PAS domain S-box-containing protein
VWTAAPDGTLTYTNERWFQYCGLTPEQNARDWPALVVHPEDHERCSGQWARAVREGTEYEIEVRHRRHDGAYRWFVTRAVPLKDAGGRVVSWFGVTTDIHDLKQMQEQLREADRRKNEFLATLAHELRNPLMPIRNGLELLRRAGDDRTALEQARTMMERQMQQLVRLIDDLLDVSRITRNRLELRLQRIELAAVVQSAVEATRPFLESFDHELTVALPDETVYLNADHTRLAQVVSNLLNNAAKYTNPHGQIRLTAWRQGEEVIVSIQDNGIGIPAEHLPRLFEMFSQVDSALERSQGGLGIGLALVRGLVEMHGGRIEARSAGPGLGSEFLLHLPVLAGGPAREPPVDGDGQTPGHAVRRILVVDDNVDSAESLSLLLRFAGHETHTVHDGLEAVKAAGWFRPDIVLLDIGLPKLNGYQAARRIRAQPWGRKLFLVAVTGWGQDEDKQRAREAGFDLHLTKPVDLARLEQILDQPVRSP